MDGEWEGERPQSIGSDLFEPGTVDGPRDEEVMEAGPEPQMACGLSDRGACHWLRVAFQEDGTASPDLNQS